MAVADCVVLIPYFESPGGLAVALDSIQDRRERLVALVVDDGSIRAPAHEVIRGRAWPIPVEVISLPRNRGIEHALNAGLLASRGRFEYVARLDCGDVCTLDRFAMQLDELDADPTLLLLGGAARYSSGEKVYVDYLPETRSDVLRMMRRRAAFCHPATVLRTSVIDLVGLYPVDFPAAEDYAYFWLIAQHGEARNLPHVVVEARVDPEGISVRRRGQQMRSRVRLLILRFDGSPSASIGLARAIVLMMTSRRFTVWLNWKRSRLMRRTAARSSTRRPF